MLTIESPWLSGRAPEHRIGRSEVQFLIGTQNFFLCLMLMTRPKNLSVGFSYLQTGYFNILIRNSYDKFIKNFCYWWLPVCICNSCGSVKLNQWHVYFQIQSENPLVLPKGIPVVRKLGFPDVIMPGWYDTFSCWTCNVYVWNNQLLASLLN